MKYKKTYYEVNKQQAGEFWHCSPDWKFDSLEDAVRLRNDLSNRSGVSVRVLKITEEEI